MDRPPEPAWRDYEERELLCNIIKLSSINPREIYNFIAQQRIGPSWDNLPLPSGRSVNECRRRYESYQNQNPYQPQPAQFPPPAGFTIAPAPYSGQRMRTTYEQQTSGGRPLLPKTTPSTPSELVPFPQSPTTEQAPVARKRGRPPKEEVVRRRAEAEARGEVYPAPRSKRAKRPSQQQEPTSPPLTTPLMGLGTAPVASTPVGTAPAETGSESSGSKRRRLPRPANIDTSGSPVLRGATQGSFESPPASTFTLGQTSAPTSSGMPDPDTRMEGLDEPAPSTRTQSYREIVGIRGSISR